MKLLGWMHPKLQKDNKESIIKHSAIGIPSIPLNVSHNYQEYYQRPCNISKANRQLQQESIITKPPTTTLTQIFPGFLAIGTLSMEPINTKPATASLVLSCEETTEENLSDRKYDASFISKEQEKLIKAAEAMKGVSEESSKSHSQASTITFSSKEKETTEEAQKENASPHKLCHGSRTADGRSNINSDRKQMHGMKKYKSPIDHVRKMLQTLQPSSKKSAASTVETSAECLPTWTKFFKTQQLFNKKVHPQFSTADVSKKLGAHKIKKTPRNCNYSNGQPTPQRESNQRFHQEAAMRSAGRYPNIDLTLPGNDITTKDLKLKAKDFSSSGPSMEHWITTDAEYLVLELQQINRDAS
ncbi:hypothetical protein Nepgr_008700 [Nepenthes gracilis]|uniref:Uncharacterized protein n=1 Tax=Nepenthes gracilis TaxID=150966 RepID=A0AAD3S957_NEPGR|nr:hypothetical protein Nepgr_008700 [Nepenthes gracilis]